MSSAVSKASEQEVGKIEKTEKCIEVSPDNVMRELGQAGRFHLRVYVLVAMAAVQVGLLHTTYIFLAADIPYR